MDGETKVMVLGVLPTLFLLVGLITLFAGSPDLADGIVCRIVKADTPEKCDQFLRSHSGSQSETTTTTTTTRKPFPLMKEAQ